MPVYASAKTMADLERVFLFAFDDPFPGYLKPEPHIVSTPFYFGETENHAVASAARPGGGQRLHAFPFRPQSDCVSQRLQRSAG